MSCDRCKKLEATLEAKNFEVAVLLRQVLAISNDQVWFRLKDLDPDLVDDALERIQRDKPRTAPHDFIFGDAQ